MDETETVEVYQTVNVTNKQQLIMIYIQIQRLY
jgi:hypothetical protein